MRLRSLSVRDFRCVESADIELADGLNVLYGPNDLGKSSLVEAIRAALLLQHSSKQGSDYKPWGTDRVPRVSLVLTDDSGRYWRVTKAFSTGRRGSATLEWSNDGKTWSLEDKNRGVDGKLRELLAWGVPDAGVKGGRGTPSSFLATILVGPQMQPGAVFGDSLASDRSETGRERLNEALQALAEDPVFKEVLEKAQDLVGRAFTKDDRKRTHKASPFRPVADRISRLSKKLDELHQQVISSENVRSQVAALKSDFDEALSERDEANAVLARAEKDHAAARARLQSKARLDEAQRQLDAIEALHADIERLRDEQHELTDARPNAEAALARDTEARSAAERVLQEAQHRAEEIEQGGDAAGKLHQQQLTTRKLQLTTERERAYGRLKQAEQARTQASELEELQDKQARLEQDLQAATEDAAASERARREAEAQRRQLDALLALRRLEDAEARLADAERAEAEATRLREEATAKRAEAQATHDEVEALALPSADEIAALRALEQSTKLAEARLGGGLALTVRASSGASVVATPDDADTGRDVAQGQTVEATRRIVVQVDGVTLEVVGGEADARAEVESLQTRWRSEAEPVLARLKLHSVEALEQQRRVTDERLAAALRQVESATSLEERASALQGLADQRAERKATVERRAEAIAGLPRAALQAEAGDRSEATLADARTQAEAAMEEASRTSSMRSKRLAELRVDAQSHRRQLDAAQRDHAEAATSLGGDPEAIVKTARDELAGIEGKLEQVETELEELARKAAGAREQAQERVDRAQRARDEAAALETKARERLDGINSALAKVHGSLEAQDKQAQSYDAAAVRTLVTTRRAELEALPEPEHEVDDEALAAIRERATAARTRAASLDKALAEQRGQLKQVGGNVILDDRTETEEALRAAQADESELELDYEAYKLLVQVMRDTESAEGRHLGQALAGPVRDRFTRLTAGRYGALALDANLGAQGLEAAGDVRSIDDLSAGLQEQLATLLRLAVAEQVDSALVLDDHLTQTDPARIAWFRDALRETASRTQVVVLTCREQDYLDGADAVHAVDLARKIRRVPTTAELPAAD